MTKVLDAFLFTHEFDLLELRLRALWPVVDKFVLVEGDHNFTNQPKEMRFKEQAERFAWAREKLIVIQSVGPFIDGPGELFVEHQHRQFLYRAAVKTQGFTGEDILMMSDIDEIPSREVIEKIKRDEFPQPLLLHQDFYYYNIRCPRMKKWHGTMIFRFDYPMNRATIGAMRGWRKSMTYVNKNCGWHFCHFYDSEGIKEKLKHSSHQHYNCPPYNDPEYLKQCVEKNENYLGKADGNTPPDPIPDYMMAELKKFPLFVGEGFK